MAQLIKSVEGRGSELLVHFAQRDPPTFEAHEAAQLLGVDSKTLARTLSVLVNRGWLSKHRHGVYEVAPLWSSPSQRFDPDRFTAVGRWVTEPYYVAFRSALEFRDLLDHPVRGRIWLAVPQSRHSPTTLRDRVTWVVLRRDLFEWGRERQWIGSGTVWVSDIERTVLDGLHLPRHIGGVDEVVAALVRTWTRINKARLLMYSQRYGFESVQKRLGFLLELLALDGSLEVAESLIGGLSSRRGAPTVLDPSLPADGPVDARWNVRVNVDPNVLRAVGQN